MNISFVGLGKLGLPLATCFAKNGHDVLAVDKNAQLIHQLKNGKTPWVEKGLKENLKEAEPHITYTSSYEGVAKTDITVILVNTPSVKKDGSFSNIYVEQTLKSLCDEFMRHGKTSHHFIISSTVMPTSIANDFVPLIENITGWKLNESFGISHVPDFVALGNIIHDFENPDFLMIGSSDYLYASEAKKLYQTILKNDPPINVLSVDEAELAKVALNAYITTKISFANYLGLLAKSINPEINVDNITNTIGQDKRIGTRFFKAGNSYGGTCFPRDTWAFMKVSKKVGMKAVQMEANEKINNLIDQEIFVDVMREVPTKILLLGASFKPGTAVTTEGLAEKLLRKLSNYSIDIHVWDVNKSAFEALQGEFPDFNLVWKPKWQKERYDVAVICNNQYEYYVEEEDHIAAKIIDPWRVTIED